MLDDNLLNVGVENDAKEENGTQLNLTADQIFAGAEAKLIQLDELTMGYHRLIKTSDGIIASLVHDKAGRESKNITPEYVLAQAENFETMLDLGMNAPAPASAFVGTESVHADPLDALRVGIEAKEGKVKEIIRKAHDFIKMIIRKVKEVSQKLISGASLLTTNMKSLKDKADELDAGYEIDKAEDKKVHNSLRDTLGEFAFDHNVIKDALTACITSMTDAYKEGSSSEIETIYTGFKTDASGQKTTLTNESEKVLNNYNIVSTGPGGAELRKLKSEKADIVMITAFKTPASTRFIYLKLKSKGKKETAAVKTLALTKKINTVTMTGNLTATGIKDLATLTLEAFEGYNAKDVIEALYDRLGTIDKDISEVSSTGKPKAVSRIMKFVAYTNAVSSASIKTIVTNQKAAYKVIKILVDNAE